jgi:purine-binding chemotaxis protein CheW
VLEGILNLAGDSVPVLRMDRLLTLAEMIPRVSSRLLIVTEPKGRIALLVDEVTSIDEFEAEQLLPVPAANTFNGCVEAQFQSGVESVSVLNLERLLVRREREVIFHFAALEQQRARLLSESAQ